MRKNAHLDEGQLIWAVLDETELPVPARKHLLGCSQCQVQKEQLARDVARLGQMAKDFAPLPGTRTVVPQEESKDSQRWFWKWQIGLAAGVVLIALWFALFMTAPEKGVTTVARKMWEDQQLMADVSFFEENALSPIHLDITGESYPVLDEEFMEFVVPLLGDIP